MRRDIGFFVEASVDQVYQAYLNAATHEPFERTCDAKPYHTISFGVNYSMKYNMNGGSCNIHFMPCGNGTAVNMRFSIAQAFGARYELYAQELNKAMRRFLPAPIHEGNYDMDEFMKPQNQVTPATLQRAAAPHVAEPLPRAAAPQGAATRFCTKCGAQLMPGGRFCTNCAQPVSPVAKACPNCGKPAEEGAAFCSACGTRL